MKERPSRGSPPSSTQSKSHDHMGKGQTAIMKADWSQQRPHTWQTGRSASCSLFRHGLSLTAEGWRHLHQFICLGVWTRWPPPPRPSAPWRHLKWHPPITAYFEKMLQTRLHLLDIDGCRENTRGLRVHFLGDEKNKTNLSYNRPTVPAESTVRGDLSLPCVAAPSSRPQCEGRPDSQELTVTALILQSLICIIHPFLLPLLHTVRHTADWRNGSFFPKRINRSYFKLT